MVFVERVKTHFRFEQRELIDLAIVSLCFGFILSFRDWGSENAVDVTFGLINFINASLIVFFSMVVTIIFQKLFAIKRAHTVNFRAWYFGLGISLYLGFISLGSWLLFLPGGLIFNTVRQFKLGTQYEGNLLHASRAYIALVGPLIHVLLAYIFYLLNSNGITNYLIQKGITLNLILAVITILPIPQVEALFKMVSKHIKHTINLDGFYIFYHSRIFYIFSLALVIALVVLLFQVHVLFALLIAAILAGTIALFYTFAQEL